MAPYHPRIICHVLYKTICVFVSEPFTGIKRTIRGAGEGGHPVQPLQPHPPNYTFKSKVTSYYLADFFCS